MNKLFLFSLPALSTFLFFLHAKAFDETSINFEDLPMPARSTITQTFHKDNISFMTKEQSDFGYEYEVTFIDGVTIEFDSKGEVQEIDCGVKQIPDALIPDKVRKQINEIYPNNFIVDWGKDEETWYAKLNNEEELVFDSEYEIVGEDD